MELIKRFINFLKRFWVFSNSDEDNTTDEEGENSVYIAEEAEEPTLEQLEEATKVAENTVVDDKIKVVQMMLSRLYMLIQKISVFKESFPDNYLYFWNQIKELEESYNDSLSAINQSMTFEIDPEKDGEKLARVMMLEKDVEAFIEKEVKFDIFEKKLQRLILKMNILYNVSVMHTRPDEKNKAVVQTKRAINVEKRIIREFKCCEYLTGDMRLKDKIVSLISYLDYQIFKVLLRNSDITPTNVIEELSVMVDFDGINLGAIFEAFLEDELKELVELIEQIQDEKLRKMLKSDYKEICTMLICSDDKQNLINIEFWNNIFTLESRLFNLLRESGIEKDAIKIKIISRMNIHLTENDVLVLPKTNAYVALMDVFSKTNDSKIILVMKLLKNISDDITYKEIYFLSVLFDIIDILKSVPNELIDDLEKYLKKYPYDDSTMNQKKKLVFSSSDSEYVYVFTIGEYEQELLGLLKQLKIDFKNVDNKIFMNEIYFSGLTTVINSLKTTNN